LDAVWKGWYEVLTELYRIISKKADDIMVSPQSLYPYSKIICGTDVCSQCGKKKMYAVASDTFRGFHMTKRAKQEGERGIDAYRKYMNEHGKRIIKMLQKIKDADKLDSFSCEISSKLKKEFQGVVLPKQLEPYNKVRKLVDLTFEHVALMAEELSCNRSNLVKILFLPLDSQMFNCCAVFAADDLKALGIKRDFTYSRITEKDHYRRIQRFLAEKAEKIQESTGTPFCRIYFDLLWGPSGLRRIDAEAAKNLFESNP
jgi:hypothetical protein